MQNKRGEEKQRHKNQEGKRQPPLKKRKNRNKGIKKEKKKNKDKNE